MNLFQKQQTTSGYISIPNDIADDETAAVQVSLGMPSPLTTTTTMDRRLSKRMLAIAAGILMVLMVVGGAVLLRDGGITTAAEGLVVAKRAHSAPCLPAGGAFSGSTTTSSQKYPFETCYQLGNDSTYCWTKSYRHTEYTKEVIFIAFYPCAPKGDAWHTIDPKYVNTPGVDPKTNPKRCGDPCQGQDQK